MSGLIETDLSKIVQKERKEGLKRVGVVLGFAAGLVGLGYAVSPDYYKQELRDNYFYCNNLLKNASGDVYNAQFVYDEVTVPGGVHAGKTCREIINEYKRQNEE